jgi:hypothetical protein
MLAPEQQQWYQAWLQQQHAQQQANVQRMAQLMPWNAAPPGVSVPFPNPLFGRANVPALAQTAPQSALTMYLMGGGADGGLQADPTMMQALLHPGSY